MSIGGVNGNENLVLTLNTAGGVYKFIQTIPDDKMRKYVFDISDISKTITRIVISPEIDECFITVKSLVFK